MRAAVVRCDDGEGSSDRPNVRFRAVAGDPIWAEFPEFFRGLALVCHRLEIPRPMPDPTLEQLDEKVYFIDASGARWRVHDVAFGSPHARPYHYRRFAVGDARATSRIFVSAGGTRRSYAFKKGEAREFAPAACEFQPARSKYLAASP